MKFGITMFPTDEAMRPDELAIAVEDRGFHSLWFPEHTHIPASRETPYPAGGELPREYTRTYDPFVGLSFAAGVTSRLLLGTGVCLVVERDPIVLAKEVASLDALSGGRFQFGVGAGWNREEMSNHGTVPETRLRLLRERIEAMKAIWTHDEATYHGEFVDFERVWSWPKPVQRPHPPIVVGGGGPTVLRRTVEYGDAWMPTGRNWDTADLGGRIAELRRLSEEAGRDPVPVYLYSASSKPEAVERYRELGVELLVFWAPPAPADVVLPQLDKYAQLVERFRD